MDQEDLQKMLCGIFANVPICQTMGLSLTYDPAGSARVTMPRDARFDHGMNDTHGGVFATLLDSAGWFTAAATTKRKVLTSNLSINLLGPAAQGTLVATGVLQWAGRRTAVTEMKLSKTDGSLIASATATFAVGDEF